MTDTTSDECLWQALGECYAELTDIPPGEDRVLAAILKVCEEVAISAIIQGFPLVPAVLAAYQAAIRSPLVEVATAGDDGVAACGWQPRVGGRFRGAGDDDE